MASTRTGFATNYDAQSGTISFSDGFTLDGTDADWFGMYVDRVSRGIDQGEYHKNGISPAEWRAVAEEVTIAKKAAQEWHGDDQDAKAKVKELDRKMEEEVTPYFRPNGGS